MSEGVLMEIFFYGDYYLKFYNDLSPAAKLKFNWTLQFIATTHRIPSKYFDHITNSSGLYEIRVEVGSDIYRVFCCFDEGKLIILFNGFIKKTPKTPKKELELAKKLKKQYFYEKASN